MYLPGGGGRETSWQSGTSTQPDAMNRFLRRITRDSFNFRFITMHTDWTYGNDTQSTRMSDALTQAGSYGLSTTRVHLVGASMGTVCALNWAKANPTKVASISLVLPLVDLDDAQPKIAALGLSTPNDAYGGAVPNDHNPIENTASFTGFPIAMWGTTNDSVCSYTQAQSFAASVGSNCTMTSLGLGTTTGFVIAGHDASNLPAQDVIDFIINNDTPASSHRAIPKSVHNAGRGQ
jgi:predicted alpha/beta hydrolase family esterase